MVAEVRERLADVRRGQQLLGQAGDGFRAYRRAVDKQVVDRPRFVFESESGQVGIRRLRHPIDRRRLQYLKTLAIVERLPQPSERQIGSISAFAVPFDPLLSEFVHREVAVLWSKCPVVDRREELLHQLHAVYFGVISNHRIGDVHGAIESLLNGNFFAEASEFGLVGYTSTKLHGTTRNPWNPELTPGGSSGGTAAAVAGGLVPIGTGTDGGGSIRIPAACCGLVGLKPSRGRVSMGPLISDGLHGLVCEGVVTRTVADTAATLDAISAADPGAWYNAPPPKRPFLEEVGCRPGRLRVAFSTQSPTGVPVAKACVDAVVETAKVLEDLGHEVFEGAPAWPEPSEIMPMFMVLWNTGGALFDISDWEQVEPVNRALRERSLAIDSSTYVRAVAQMQIYSRMITASWGRDFDFLITPTLAVEPPEIGEIWEGYDNNPEEPIIRAGAMVPFTPLFNVTGQPAVSLPLCQAESGLPTGVQLVGGPWDEAGVLRLAAQLEEAMPWRDRRPAMV